jgi:hypothetical protein
MDDRPRNKGRPQATLGGDICVEAIIAAFGECGYLSALRLLATAPRWGPFEAQGRRELQSHEIGI